MVQVVQGHSLCCVPWRRETFEQTLPRAPAPWSDPESAHPRAKALARAASWRSAPAWVPLWPQLAPGLAISPHHPPPLPSLPFCPGRRGFVLPTQTGSSRGWAVHGQTLKLCSWGEEWPLLYGGELGAELVTQEWWPAEGPGQPSPSRAGPRQGLRDIRVVTQLGSGGSSLETGVST